MNVSVDLGVEERRLAMEVIINLCYMKSSLVELILSPAGVPPHIARILYKNDSLTGKVLTKRQAAPLIVEAIESDGRYCGVIRAIVEMAGAWSSFHLAEGKEYEARATVQKARDLVGTIRTMDEREARQRELAREESLAELEKENAASFRKHNNLLLMMFDQLTQSKELSHRGYLLQDLLNRLFDLHRIPVLGSFTRNGGGEQIDGAFRLDGWHYLVECRWRAKLAGVREIDGLLGQVRRSGKNHGGFPIDKWMVRECSFSTQAERR